MASYSLNSFGCEVFRGDPEMTQWWEHSPRTSGARVRFPDLASYVGWVCCFSALHREIFSGCSGSPLLRNQHLSWLDLCRLLILVCSVPNQCSSARTKFLPFPFLSCASYSAYICWTKYWYWRHAVSLKVTNKCLPGRTKFTVNSRLINYHVRLCRSKKVTVLFFVRIPVRRS